MPPVQPPKITKNELSNQGNSDDDNENNIYMPMPPVQPPKITKNELSNQGNSDDDNENNIYHLPMPPIQSPEINKNEIIYKFKKRFNIDDNLNNLNDDDILTLNKTKNKNEINRLLNNKNNFSNNLKNLLTKINNENSSNIDEKDDIIDKFSKKIENINNSHRIKSKLVDILEKDYTGQTKPILQAIIDTKDPSTLITQIKTLIKKEYKRNNSHNNDFINLLREIIDDKKINPLVINLLDNEEKNDDDEDENGDVNKIKKLIIDNTTIIDENNILLLEKLIKYNYELHNNDNKNIENYTNDILNKINTERITNPDIINSIFKIFENNEDNIIENVKQNIFEFEVRKVFGKNNKVNIDNPLEKRKRIILNKIEKEINGSGTTEKEIKDLNEEILKLLEYDGEDIFEYRQNVNNVLVKISSNYNDSTLNINKEKLITKLNNLIINDRLSKGSLYFNFLNDKSDDYINEFKNFLNTKTNLNNFLEFVSYFIILAVFILKIGNKDITDMTTNDNKIIMNSIEEIFENKNTINNNVLYEKLLIFIDKELIEDKILNIYTVEGIGNVYNLSLICMFLSKKQYNSESANFIFNNYRNIKLKLKLKDDNILPTSTLFRADSIDIDDSKIILDNIKSQQENLIENIGENKENIIKHFNVSVDEITKEYISLFLLFNSLINQINDSIDNTIDDNVKESLLDSIKTSILKCNNYKTQLDSISSNIMSEKDKQTYYNDLIEKNNELNILKNKTESFATKVTNIALSNIINNGTDQLVKQVVLEEEKIDAVKRNLTDQEYNNYINILKESQKLLGGKFPRIEDPLDDKNKRIYNMIETFKVSLNSILIELIEINSLNAEEFYELFEKDGKLIEISATKTHINKDNIAKFILDFMFIDIKPILDGINIEKNKRGGSPNNIKITINYITDNIDQINKIIDDSEKEYVDKIKKFTKENKDEKKTNRVYIYYWIDFIISIILGNNQLNNFNFERLRTFNNSEINNVITSVIIDKLLSLSSKIENISNLIMVLKYSIQNKDFMVKLKNIIARKNNKHIITYVKIRNNNNYDYNRRFDIKLSTDDSERNTSILLKYNTDDDPYYILNDRGTLVLSDYIKKLFKDGVRIDQINEKTTSIKYKIYNERYLFGNFTNVFLQDKNNKDISDKLTEISSQLEEGRPVFMIGYGASGAGKTSTLIYFNKAKTEEDKNGILVHLCNKFVNTHDKIEVSSKELYIDYASGERETVLRNPKKDYFVFKADTNTNNYTFVCVGNAVKCDPNEVKDLDKINVNDTNVVNPENLKKIVEDYKKEGTEYKNKHLYRIKSLYESNKKDLDYYIQNKTGKKYFKVGDKLGNVIIHLIDIDRYVKATTNNPNSSRSHTLIFIKFKPKEAKYKEMTLIVGDFAGVENEFACNEEYVQKLFASVKRDSPGNPIFYATEIDESGNTINYDPTPKINEWPSITGGAEQDYCLNYNKSQDDFYNFNLLERKENKNSDKELLLQNTFRNPAIYKNIFNYIVNFVLGGNSNNLKLNEKNLIKKSKEINKKFNDKENEYNELIDNLQNVKNNIRNINGVFNEKRQDIEKNIKNAKDTIINLDKQIEESNNNKAEINKKILSKKSELNNIDSVKIYVFLNDLNKIQTFQNSYCDYKSANCTSYRNIVANIHRDIKGNTISFKDIKNDPTFRNAFKFFYKGLYGNFQTSSPIKDISRFKSVYIDGQNLTYFIEDDDTNTKFDNLNDAFAFLINKKGLIEKEINELTKQLNVDTNIAQNFVDSIKEYIINRQSFLNTNNFLNMQDLYYFDNTSNISNINNPTMKKTNYHIDVIKYIQDSMKLINIIYNTKNNIQYQGDVYAYVQQNISFLESVKITDDDIKSFKFIYNDIQDIFLETLCRLENARNICNNRLIEGQFINKSLYELRKVIEDMLVYKKNELKINLIPNYIQECRNSYCFDSSTKFKCFQISNKKNKLNRSVIFDNIINEIYKDSNDNINILYEKIYKELVIALFCVFNANKDAYTNNPPPIPHININYIQKYINQKSFYGSNKLSLINQIDNNMLKSINTVYKNKLKIMDTIKSNIVDDTTVLENIKRIIKDHNKNKNIELDKQDIDSIQEFINIIDQSNAASSIGTLEFTDKLSKFNTTNIVCMYNAEKMNLDRYIFRDMIEIINSNNY
jgi:hypothetical protein